MLSKLSPRGDGREPYSSKLAFWIESVSGSLGWYGVPVWLTLSIPLYPCQGGPPPSNLSSRPERSRISCHAALTNARVCGFQYGKPHEVRQRHQARQEIRGSVVERPAVSPSPLPRKARRVPQVRPSVPARVSVWEPPHSCGGRSASALRERVSTLILRFSAGNAFLLLEEFP